MNILQALENGSDWQAMGELVEITGLPANKIREKLKSFIDEGIVIKIGNKRSTRYSLFGTEEPEMAPTSSNLSDFTDAIRNVMLKYKSKVDRQTLCKELNTYDLKMKPSLMAMVESGEVLENGKARGQLFWLAIHEEKGLIEPEVEAAPKEGNPRKFKLPTEDGEDEKTLMPEINDPVDLVKHGVSLIPDGKEFLVMELGLLIHKSHNNHQINQWQVLKGLQKVYKEKLVPRLHVLRRQEPDGLRYFYCIGEMPDQFAGELMGRSKPKPVEDLVDMLEEA